MTTGDDPILDTAQRAAKDLGLKILVIRRHSIARETFVARSTRVLRALTDSTLHRSLFGTEGDTIDVPRRSRRVLILAVVCVALGVAAIVYGWLANHC